MASKICQEELQQEETQPRVVTEKVVSKISEACISSVKKCIDIWSFTLPHNMLGTEEFFFVIFPNTDKARPNCKSNQQGKRILSKSGSKNVLYVRRYFNNRIKFKEQNMKPHLTNRRNWIRGVLEQPQSSVQNVVCGKSPTLHNSVRNGEGKNDLLD